jgi:hypothetical protein
MCLYSVKVVSMVAVYPAQSSIPRFELSYMVLNVTYIAPLSPTSQSVCVVAGSSQSIDSEKNIIDCFQNDVIYNILCQALDQNRVVQHIG